MKMLRTIVGLAALASVPAQADVQSASTIIGDVSTTCTVTGDYSTSCTMTRDGKFVDREDSTYDPDTGVLRKEIHADTDGKVDRIEIHKPMRVTEFDDDADGTIDRIVKTEKVEEPGKTIFIVSKDDDADGVYDRVKLMDMGDKSYMETTIDLTRTKRR